MVGLSVWLSIWLLCGSILPALAVDPCHTWPTSDGPTLSVVKCTREDEEAVAVDKKLTVEDVLTKTCKVTTDVREIASLFGRDTRLETCTAALSTSVVSFDVKLRCKFHSATELEDAELGTQDTISSACEVGENADVCKRPLHDKRSLMHAIQRACVEKLDLFDHTSRKQCVKKEEHWRLLDILDRTEPLCPEFMLGDTKARCDWDLSYKGDHVAVDIFQKVQVQVSFIPVGQLPPAVKSQPVSSKASGSGCKLAKHATFFLSQDDFTRNYVTEKVLVQAQARSQARSQANSEAGPEPSVVAQSADQGAAVVDFEGAVDAVDAEASERGGAKMVEVDREGVPLARLQQLLFNQDDVLGTLEKNFNSNRYILTCSERDSTRLAENRATQDDACLYIKIADVPNLEFKIEPAAEIQVHFPRESGVYNRYVVPMPLTFDPRKQAGAEPERARQLTRHHIPTVMRNTRDIMFKSFHGALNAASRNYPKQAVKLLGSVPLAEVEVFEALFYCFQDVQDPDVRFYLPFASTPFTTWRDLKLLLSGRRNLKSAGPEYSTESEPLTLFFGPKTPAAQVAIDSSMDDQYINVADRMEPFVFGVPELQTNVIFFHFPESSPEICWNSPLVYDANTPKPDTAPCEFETTDFLAVSHTRSQSASAVPSAPSSDSGASVASVAPKERLCVFRRRLSVPDNPWEGYPESVAGMSNVPQETQLIFRTDSLLLPRACCLAFGEPPRRCQLVEEFSDTLTLHEDGKGLSALDSQLVPLQLVHTDQVLLRLHRGSLPKYIQFPPSQPLTELYLNRDAHFKMLINSCRPKEIEREKERQIVAGAGLLAFRCTGPEPDAEPKAEPKAEPDAEPAAEPDADKAMLSRLIDLVETQLRNRQQKCPSKVIDLYFLEHKGHSLSAARIQYDVMVIEDPLGDPAECASSSPASSTAVGSAVGLAVDSAVCAAPDAVVDSEVTQTSKSFVVHFSGSEVGVKLSREAIGGGLTFAFIKDLISIRETGKAAPEKSVLKVIRQLGEHIDKSITSQMATFESDPKKWSYTFELRDTDAILSLASLSSTDYVSSWIFSLVTPPSNADSASTTGPKVPTFGEGRIKILRYDKLGQGAFGMVVRAKWESMPTIAGSAPAASSFVEQSSEGNEGGNKNTQCVAARRKRRHQDIVDKKRERQATAADGVLKLPEVTAAVGKPLVAKLFKCDGGTSSYDGFFTEVYVNRQIQMRHKELQAELDVPLDEYLPTMVTYGLLFKNAEDDRLRPLQHQCSFMYIVYTSGGSTTLDNALFIEARKRTFFSPTKFAMAISSDLKIFASAALRLAQAVQYLSDLDIYHYDLKPANIMLTMDRVDDPNYEKAIASMKLIDIGVVLDAQVADLPPKDSGSPNPLKWLDIDKFQLAAKTLYTANKKMRDKDWTLELRRDLKEPPTTTPARMSPLMDKYDQSFTVYQLGLIFVELLLGVPIQASADAIVLDPYADIAAGNPAIAADKRFVYSDNPAIFRSQDDCPNKQLFLQEKKQATAASIITKALTEAQKPGSKRYEQILEIAQHFSYTKVLRESEQKERIKELIIGMLDSDPHNRKDIDCVVTLLEELVPLCSASSPSTDEQHRCSAGSLTDAQHTGSSTDEQDTGSSTDEQHLPSTGSEQHLPSTGSEQHLPSTGFSTRRKGTDTGGHQHSEAASAEVSGESDTVFGNFANPRASAEKGVDVFLKKKRTGNKVKAKSTPAEKPPPLPPVKKLRPGEKLEPLPP